MIAIFLSTLLPIFAIVACAWGLGQTFTLDTNSLSKVSLYLLFPALIIRGILDGSENSGDPWGICFSFLLISSSLLLILWLVGRWRQWSRRRLNSMILGTLYSNLGNMGLSILLFSMDKTGVENGLVYLVASATILAIAMPVILSSKGFWLGLKRSVQMPLLWAALVGLLFKSLGWELPENFHKSVNLLADAAIPLALIMLGIELGYTPIKFGKSELAIAALRLIISPLLAYFWCHALGLALISQQAVIIQSAMPTGVNSIVWAKEFDGDTAFITRAIACSTLTSFFTLPIVLSLVLNH